MIEYIKIQQFLQSENLKSFGRKVITNYSGDLNFGIAYISLIE